MLAAITRSIRALLPWPKPGRRATVYGAREFLVRRLPFLIVCRVDIGDDDEVVILRICHVRLSR